MYGSGVTIGIVVILVYSYQTNPQGPSSGTTRVIRGGCWFNGIRSERVASRGYYLPNALFNQLGFRLAYSTK